MPRILIVDDHLPARRLFEEVFLSAGFSTLTAGDGAEALTLLAGDIPEVIVTDLIMPGLDGLGLLRALGCDAKWSQIPVVVVTGVSSPTVLAQAHSLGATEVVIKPFSPSDLVRAVEAALIRHAVPRLESDPPRWVQVAIHEMGMTLSRFLGTTEGDSVPLVLPEEVQPPIEITEPRHAALWELWRRHVAGRREHYRAQSQARRQGWVYAPIQQLADAIDVAA